MQSVEINDNQSELIEYRNVTVSQSNRVILEGINLSINLGEYIAILGPNGAGKTFLIKTITREKYPQFGIRDSYLRIMGRESWNVFELRNLLGIVSESLLTPRARFFTGRQIVLSGFFSSTGIWSRRHKVIPEMERKTREVMEQLEISHLAERKLGEMSAGEIRRVLICRALVHNPRALVFDEPSASLDFRGAREVREIMRKIAGAGTSIIMVTHDLADIIPEISRVILLKEGSIIKDGSKEEVLTSESLSALYGIPLKVGKRDGYFHLK